MRIRFILPIVAAMALALAGCEGQGPKQIGGTLLGGAAGALAGSQFGGGAGRVVATAVGTLAGAWIGSEVGKSLDRADQLAMQRTSQSALETNKTGQTARWSNPDSGHSGTITPTKTYEASAGQPCREYQQTVTIGGRTEQAYGTACRQADGSWKVVR